MTSKPAPKSLETVLVVGGCGFLGSHVVEQLLNFPSESSGDPERIVSGAAHESTNSSASHGTNEKSSPSSQFSFSKLKDRYPSYQNTQVAVLDLHTERNRLPGAHYYNADITSADEVLAVFRKVKPSVVIHTATPSLFIADKALQIRVNVDGTRTLVEVAGGEKGDWGGKCKAFVFTSSSSVVHDARSDLVGVDERWPYMRGPQQLEFYSEAKANAEELVLQHNRKYNNMLTSAIRPAGIIGEREIQFTYNALLHARNSKPSTLRFQLGSNENLFDFTYVANIVYGHLLAAERLIATYDRLSSGGASPLDHERVDGEAFNITNDEPCYFWDMTRALYAWYDASKVIEPEQVWALPEGLMLPIGGIAEALFGLFGKTPRLTRRAVKYSCMTRYFSCNKAKVRLGYTPIVDLEEGLKRCVASFVQRERTEGLKNTL